MADSVAEKTGLQGIRATAIEKRIFVIRERQVMLDEDLADLYGVETKRLIEQVKRNLERFPKDFMFQLDGEEAAALRSQIATSNTGRGGRRYAPYVFTEQGVGRVERGMGEHDEQLEQIFNALRQLITPPMQPRHPVGFRVRDE